MGSDITPDNLRGFLIPSSTFSNDSLWSGYTQVTQQNGRAGIPEAQQTGTSMVLSSIGDQDEDITIITQNGGTAGVNANYTFKKGLVATEYGRNWKSILTSWDLFKFGTTAGSIYTHTDAMQMIDGVLYFVTEYYQIAGQRGIEVYKKDKSAAVTLVDRLFSANFPTLPNNDGHPIILGMEDGSIYVAHFNFSTGDYTNITAYRSYDAGATWQRITENALIENIDMTSSGYNIKDMRAVVTNNVVTLFVELTSNSGSQKNHVAQYRSVDSGLTFELVGQVSTNAEGRFHSVHPVKLPGGYTGMAYIDATTRVRFVKIPNPGIRASSSGWSANVKTVYSGVINFANLVSSELQDGDLTTWYQDGRVFIFVREYNNGKIYGFYSDDDGDTWQGISNYPISVLSERVVYDFGSWNDRLDHMVAVPFEGRTLLLAHAKFSIQGLYFGGYSSEGFPKLTDYPAENNYMTWASNYIPVDEPDVSSYWNTTGAGAHVVGSAGLNIICSATQDRYYTYTGGLPSNFDEGLVLRFRLKVDSGTSTASGYIAVRATVDDGTNSRMVNLRFSTTQIVIRDNATTKATINVDMTNEYEFRIAWSGQNAKVSIRRYDQNQEKNWTTNTYQIAPYATGAGNTLAWGHLQPAPTGGNESTWQEFHVKALVPAGTNPTADALYSNVLPAPYPPFGQYAYVHGGMSITTKQSPARGEDEYKINTRYDFPIENVFYQVAMSPRLVWRSADDTTQQLIAFYVDPDAGAVKSYHDTDAIGIHLNNINFEEFTIRRLVSSAWVTIMTVNNSGLGGAFERAGHSIQPTGTTNDFYLHHNEARGWRCKLDDGAGNVKIVKILSNTEGSWGKNTDQKRPVLILDAELSDVATLPATGTCSLIPDAVTLVIDALDNVTQGDIGFRIDIPVQPTLEGYYQVGSLVYGHVAFPAPQYQRGRSITFEANIQEETTLDNMFYSRKMSNGARRVSLAWTEPIDETKIQERDPDYWQLSDAAGAHPVANYGDAAQVMHGIARQLNNEVPIVYLPKIEKNDRLQIINRRMDHVYCRLDGPVTIDSVLGDEGINEAFRIATINLVEIE